MRNSMKETMRDTVQGFVDIGIKTSFTKRQLDELGVEIKDIKIDSNKIKNIRKIMNLSQTVFAKILNVSIGAVRQWEQGKRTPTGSTMVLLEMLEKEPDLLDYRIPN